MNDTFDEIELDNRTATIKRELRERRRELNNIAKSRDRWSKIDLGIIQTIVAKCFKNLSQQTSTIFAIISNILFSLFDTCSDLAIAFTLFANEDSESWKYGVVVLIVDYLPGWELLVHNLCSEKWRMLNRKKEFIFTIVFLIVSPFSLPLFFIRWLLAFNKANNEMFNCYSFFQ